jgi:hypothetical protein
MEASPLPSSIAPVLTGARLPHTCFPLITVDETLGSFLIWEHTNENRLALMNFGSSFSFEPCAADCPVVSIRFQVVNDLVAC